MGLRGWTVFDSPGAERDALEGTEAHDGLGDGADALVGVELGDF
jgi:hypothetical protein